MKRFNGSRAEERSKGPLFSAFQPPVLLCTILPRGLLTSDLTDRLGCRLLVCYWLYPLTKQAGNWRLPNNPMRGWPTACSAYRLLVDGVNRQNQIRNVAGFILFYLAKGFLTYERGLWELQPWIYQSRLTTCAITAGLFKPQKERFMTGLSFSITVPLSKELDPTLVWVDAPCSKCTVGHIA